MSFVLVWKSLNIFKLNSNYCLNQVSIWRHRIIKQTWSNRASTMNFRQARLPSYCQAPTITNLIIGLTPLIELRWNLVWSHLNSIKYCFFTATLSNVRAEVGLTIGYPTLNNILAVQHWENRFATEFFWHLSNIITNKILSKGTFLCSDSFGCLPNLPPWLASRRSKIVLVRAAKSLNLQQ